MPDDDIPDGEVLDENIRAELRKAREYRAEAEAAKAEAEAAKREAAFARAGVPDTPLHQQLAKGYEGDSDPSSVKAYFEGLGVDLGSGVPQQEPPDLAEQRRLAEVGSTGDPGGDVKFEDAINSTSNVDEVMDLLRSAPEGATTWIEGRARRIGVPRIE